MSKIETGTDGNIRLSQEYPLRENPQLTDAIIVGDIESGTVASTTTGNIKTLYTGSIAENNTGFVTGGDVAAALASKPDGDDVTAALDKKVDKVEGMGLSHEDYTAPEKDDVATLSMFYKPVNDALDAINGEPVRGGVPGKLAKLKGSKESIRQAIVSKGVEVTEQEPFKNYSDKISGIQSSGDYDSQINLFNRRQVLTKIGSEYDATLSTLTDGSYLFYDYNNLTSFSADLSALTNAKYMFCSCTGLTSFSSDLSALTNGNRMFYACLVLTSFISDLPALTNGNAMFCSCRGLTSFSTALPVMTDGDGMFADCPSLTSFSADLSAMTNGSRMFYDCSNLTSFSSDLSAMTNGANMFWKCFKLTDITLTGSLNADGMDLSESPLLTVESLLNVLNALADRTGQPAKTLLLGTSIISKLTAEQKAIATDKNWVLF